MNNGESDVQATRAQRRRHQRDRHRNEVRYSVHFATKPRRNARRFEIDQSEFLYDEHGGIIAIEPVTGVLLRASSARGRRRRRGERALYLALHARVGSAAAYFALPPR